ncbi:MAG: ribbon-helix-helix protein, CopG family [Stigonema ocellatum SAG 48.90 = DSM 106950]|nr:ribbon-helix-helix protein, CopG family [Stigonema ocellatum SAG 48.90 = DSM 106950]
MGKPTNSMTFRLSDEEKDILKAYCEQMSRSQSDVLRELIRGLSKKTSRHPKGCNQPSSLA